MSVRNRPRGTVIKDDTADELQLWNTIVEKIKKCSTISEKYEEIAARIIETEDTVPDDDPGSAVIILSTLEENHRACLKHSEQLLNVLNDEPDDLIKNLETLISVRAAFEVDSPPPASGMAAAAANASSTTQTSATANSSSRATPAPTGASSKSLRGKRKFDSDGTADGTPEPTVIINSAPGGPTGSAGGRTTGRAASRSGSVAAASVKSEAGLDAAEAAKNVASDKQSATKFLTVGSEVYFRNKDRRSEGEGILCRITNVIGDGKQRRYEIQDTEPDEGQEVTPWRAPVTSLIAVPPPGTAASALPPLTKGKQVFALYPGTNTFYKAEMVGVRKDMCRIKFEGEEPADKEVDVERRHVLEYR